MRQYLPGKVVVVDEQLTAKMNADIERAKALKSAYLREAEKCAEQCEHNLAQVKKRVDYWRDVALYQVLEFEADELRRAEQGIESIADINTQVRDEKESAEQRILAKGATQVSVALLVLAIAASVITPFFLNEYAARVAVATAWICFSISIFFCF